MDWGYRYLTCRPDFFDVEYEINPWMNRAVPVDRDLARQQWEDFMRALSDAGASVEVIQQVPGLPDMVFTANLGMLAGGSFVPARMRHPERQPESELARRWMIENGFGVEVIDTDLYFEGAGDALPFRDVLVVGHGQRSDKEAWALFSRETLWKSLPVRLIDPRFYHLDLAFCPLSNDSALVAPSGIAKQSLAALVELVPDPIMLTPDEVSSFTANSVVVGRTVIMPSCSTRLGHELVKRRFEPVVVTVGEFAKAGGACRCLTLALDVANGLSMKATSRIGWNAPRSR